MELKDFVKNVLVDIHKAVNEADIAVDRNVEFAIDRDGIGNVHFDIAVTVESNDGSKVGGSIKVLELLSGGAEKIKSSSSERVSRVQFGIKLESKNSKQKMEYNSSVQSRSRGHSKQAAPR